MTRSDLAEAPSTRLERVLADAGAWKELAQQLPPA